MTSLNRKMKWYIVVGLMTLLAAMCWVACGPSASPNLTPTSVPKPTQVPLLTPAPESKGAPPRDETKAAQPEATAPKPQPRPEENAPAVSTTESDEATQKVEPDVIEKLEVEGEALIVIALVEPPAMHESKIDLPKLKKEIADLQDQVLSELDPVDFQVRIRFQSIPAIAGTLKTEQGLEKLVSNPNVVKIGLDVGGSGAQ